MKSLLGTLLARPMARRILAGTGSNAYAQATTIGIQLLSLPIFLSHWDLQTYGQWLVLSAVPAYLAMSDVGMVTAAGNRMTMLIADGEQDAANRVFQSALAFVLIACGIAALVVGAGAWAWRSASTDSAEAAVAMGLLAAGVIAGLVGGLPEAVYKATERYPLGAALANTTRLLEWLGSLAGLWWFGDFIGVAFGALVPRALCTALMMLHAARSTPAFRWGFGDASVGEIRRCAGPALSFMVFPAANALNFQGMTLVAAAVLGPAATVMFNAYRTLARVTVQATATFSHALWPEFSRLFGRRDGEALAALYHRSRWLGLTLAAAASAVVYLVAPVVLEVWSKGRIEFVPSLMLVAMLYAAAAGAWHVPRVLLLSTNEHRALAWPYLAASAVALPVAWVLAHALGLTGTMLAMLVLELGMLLYCTRLCQRLFQRLLSGVASIKPVGAAA